MYQLASPKNFYNYAGRLIPWLAVSALTTMAIGMVWGLVFAPPDYQQGMHTELFLFMYPALFYQWHCMPGWGFWPFYCWCGVSKWQGF
ncbi:hypothetical protein PGH44_10935 [Legionella pneumophila]|nr:hypothetical protein PGH44_10935 [Legionella pneumophila]